MALLIGQTAPDFEAETTQGKIRFHDWIGNSYAVLFSHPKDFTPVCSTELGYLAGMKDEFDRRNTRVIGLSVDPVEDHQRWAEDIHAITGHALNYPIVGDKDLLVAKRYGMLPMDADGDSTERAAADNQTVRNVFIIGPDKKIRLIMVYPMSAGRNFDEILRVLDAIQLADNHPVVTPANWTPGQKVIIAVTMPDTEAEQRYPNGWDAPKPYIRYVDQPGD